MCVYGANFASLNGFGLGIWVQTIIVIDVLKVPVATDDVEVLQRITKQLFGSFHLGKSAPSKFNLILVSKENSLRAQRSAINVYGKYTLVRYD